MKAYAECPGDMERRLGTVQVENNEVATPRDLALAKVEVNCTFWLIVQSISKNMAYAQTRETRFVSSECSLQILAKMGQYPLI